MAAPKLTLPISQVKRVKKYSRPMLKPLLKNLRHKKCILESRLVWENPFIPSDLPEALKYIKKHPDYVSYHLLLAVRRYYPASYTGISTDDKVAILCSALKTSKWLNDWGSLTPYHSFDDESAEALMETGKAALKSLGPILENGECGPLYGSKEATISYAYNYCRKDFAYRYPSLILGRSPEFSVEVKERDAAIEKLKVELKKKAAER